MKTSASFALILLSACTASKATHVQDASAAADALLDRSTDPGNIVIPDVMEDIGIDRRCGDGVPDRNEECDDGNTLSNDGCSSRCQIEDGWPPACPAGGCVSRTVCGDGRLTSDEVCDDGDGQDGDGCSADCQNVEPGWFCRVPGRRCTPICGDRAVRGAETCDDGNTSSGDGCSAYCLTEPGWFAPTTRAPRWLTPTGASAHSTAARTVALVTCDVATASCRAPRNATWAT